MKYLYVGIGGALGALCRYALGDLFVLKSGFPLAIILINIIGSFLLGFLLESFKYNKKTPNSLKLGLTGGFLGGFTTFSTFSLNLVQLLSDSPVFMAIIFLLSNVIGGVFCAWLGYLSATYNRQVGAKK